MLISAELRWFWLGDRPENVENWYRKSGREPGGGAEPPRRDRYYHHQGNTELGIKVRDELPGRPPDVEVKGLVATFDASAFGLPVKQAEIWCKWKAPPLTSPAHEFVVEKLRWLRKFDADSNELTEIALRADEKPRDPDRKLPVTGCNVEWTRVGIQGRNDIWWSLCFEAFGDLDSAPEVLARVLAHMRDMPSIDGKALSYPAWLDQLSNE